MINLPPTNAGYADGADLDEWTPFDGDERIQMEIELGLMPGVIKEAMERT